MKHALVLLTLWGLNMYLVHGQQLCVSALPLPDTVTVCLGDSLLISLPTHQTATYSWQGPNGFTANGPKISVLPSLIDSGLYVVTRTVTGQQITDSLWLRITNQGCEQCFNELDDDGDGLIDFYDPDCCFNRQDAYFRACEPVCNPLDSLAIVPRRKYQIPRLNNWNLTNHPIAGDIDGDGEVEIVGYGGSASSFQNSGVRIYDGATGSLEAYLATNAKFHIYAESPVIADVDRDGYGEIFALVKSDTNFVGNSFICYGYDTLTSSFQRKWAASINICYSGRTLCDRAGSTAVADFNQDGKPEVYWGNFIFNALNGQLLLAGHEDSARGNSTNWPFNWNVKSIAADVLPDKQCRDCAGLELIAGNTVYSVHIDTLQPNLSRLEAVVQVSHLDGFTSVADMDGDGDLDGIIAVQSSQFLPANNVSAIYIWDLQTPQLLAPLHITPPLSTYFNMSSIGLVDDLNGDQTQDILLTRPNSLLALSYNSMGLQILWQASVTDLSGWSQPTTFDLNGDGRREVIFRGNNFVYFIDGPTGNILATDTCISTTIFDGVIVADLDQDGAAEVTCTCDDGLRVYESATTPWEPARPVWNQISYFGVNINDNLQVPIKQQNHAIVGDSMVLNRFLVQYGPSKSFDLKIDQLSVNCAPGGWQVAATVTNIGNSDAPSGISLRLFEDSLGQRLSQQQVIPVLQPGECYRDTFFITPSAPSGLLTVNLPIGSLSQAEQSSECTLEDNFLIVPFPDPAPIRFSLPPDTGFCAGTPVWVKALTSQAQSFLWSNGSTTDSILVQPKAGDSLKLSLSLTDSVGCAQQDSLLIRGLPLPIVDITGSTSGCVGDSLVLRAQGTPGVSLLWSTGNNTDRLSIFLDTARTISIVATDNVGCTNEDSVDLTVWPSPDLRVSPDTGVCTGNTVSLTASAQSGVQFLWSNGSIDRRIEVSPSSSNTYTVTGTTPQGCQQADTVMVTVYPLPEVTISGDTRACEGTLAQLVAEAPTAVQLLWNDGDTSEIKIVTATQNQTFTLVVTDQQGCLQNDSIFLKVIPPPSIEVSNPGIICRGQTVQLEATGAENYVWSTGQTGSSIAFIPAGSTELWVLGYTAGCVSDT
ncbi:MAG: VCBS repeat-containing protein, partial [Bacteroidota bacterium]